MRKGQRNQGTSKCLRIQTLCTPLWKDFLMRANPLETGEEKTSNWSLSETVDEIVLPKNFTGWLLIEGMDTFMFDLGISVIPCWNLPSVNTKHLDFAGLRARQSNVCFV